MRVPKMIKQLLRTALRRPTENCRADRPSAFRTGMEYLCPKSVRCTCSHTGHAFKINCCCVPKNGVTEVSRHRTEEPWVKDPCWRQTPEAPVCSAAGGCVQCGPVWTWICTGVDTDVHGYWTQVCGWGTGGAGVGTGGCGLRGWGVGKCRCGRGCAQVWIRVCACAGAGAGVCRCAVGAAGAARRRSDCQVGSWPSVGCCGALPRDRWACARCSPTCFFNAVHTDKPRSKNQGSIGSLPFSSTKI